MVKRVALLCGLVCLFGLVANADIIVNGGFETGDFTGWTQTGDGSYSGVST